MLVKKANLGVTRDEEGWVIVDKGTMQGVKVPEEAMMQITLAIWEYCDKLKPEEIVNMIIGPNKVTAEQKAMVENVVSESLKFFRKAGWVVEKKGSAKNKPAKKKTVKKKKAVKKKKTTKKKKSVKKKTKRKTKKKTSKRKSAKKKTVKRKKRR